VRSGEHDNTARSVEEVSGPKRRIGHVADRLGSSGRGKLMQTTLRSANSRAFGAVYAVQPAFSLRVNASTTLATGSTEGVQIHATRRARR